MKHFDAIIVGGGPAGSSCAWRLVQQGMNVIVVDKKTFPRVKPCAGWITPQVVDSLEIDLNEYRRDNVCQPITGFRTGMMNGPEVFTSYNQPVSYGIRRCEFDAFLLNRCGASVEFRPVEKLDKSNGVWKVNDRYQAPLLVGAGGHFCPVAKHLGTRQQSLAPVVVAQEVEFEMTEAQEKQTNIDAATPELYFCNDLTGYAWCFRKANFLNIGLGRIDKRQLSQHVTAFCSFLRSSGKVDFDITDKFLGHAYQLYAQPDSLKMYDDHLVLVGDAAGLAYMHSGEGIRPAVESGLIAADTIGQCDGDYAHQQLARYQRQCLERFGKPPSSSRSSWLPAAWQKKLAARLMATKWFTRKVVIENWFLHRNQPAL